uniref:Uncharacterized protein n=1 Tax=viral metagenome TaxID=1070528 RepID=A0A6M3JHT6_9ZZZZ
MSKVSEVGKAVYNFKDDIGIVKSKRSSIKINLLMGVGFGLVLLFAVIGFYYAVFFYFKFNFKEVLLEWIY